VDPATTPGGTTDPLRVQEASQGIAATYATLITQRSFLAEIAPQVVDGELSAGELKSRIHATAIEDTSLIAVRAEGASTEKSATASS
jgi:capsular polysaccharide biosynthesis protein